jgi:predicted nucleic acid-binding protein
MAEMVTDLPVVDVIQDDPTDNVILACAEKAEANFIITGDQHLLSLKEFGQAKIVTPREFLTIHPGQI